jgi:uncharacterized protein YqhQ
MDNPELKCLAVGGQAVIEGVMMRGPSCLAVAVRNPKGELVVRDQPWRSIWERLRFLRWPFLRGAVILFESMANGMNALAYSADIAAQGQPGDGDKPAPAPGQGSGPSMWWVLIPTLVFALLIFKGVPHFVALGLDAWVGGGHGTSGYLFHAIDGVVKLLLFVGYILLISRMKDVQRVFAYHGAEHKSIATHEAGEALTVANARKHSRFHPRCGTAFLLYVIVIGVLLYMAILPVLPPLVAVGWLNQTLLVLLKIVLLFPIAGLSYEAIRLAGKFGRNPLVRLLIAPGLGMQRLVTREPTDDQLEVALTSIATALAREEASKRAKAGEQVAVPPEREQVFADYAAFRDGLATWYPDAARESA